MEYNFESVTHLYFMGIKGVGMAGLAVIAKQAGFIVSGSDVAETFITDEILEAENIAVDSSFDKNFIDSFFDDAKEKGLLIYTAAHHGRENPQVEYALSQGIPVLSYGQAVSLFQSGNLIKRETVAISVAGAHGKTTTSAMIAVALQALNQNPSYLIGTSSVKQLGGAGHLGSGKYFVVESDEYVADTKYDRTPKFLYQLPDAAIVTNVDFDHPDVFTDMEAMKDAFGKFAGNIHENGVLVYNGDDVNSALLSLKLKPMVRAVSFGEHNADYCLQNFRAMPEGITFHVVNNSNDGGEFFLPVFGHHNALNATAVVALLHELGFEFQEIKEALKKFQGTKRRLELVGKTAGGATIIDDYAHHPKEIEASLSALKQAFPEKTLVCIFQPHTLSRTVSLIEEFENAFKAADTLLLLDIFPSAREGAIDEAKQAELYDRILSKNKGKFISGKQNMVEYCTQNFNTDKYLIVTMGAGDVYKISLELKVKS